MKQVLVISPSPSHPQNAGDRARIFALVTWLQNRGFELQFLYISGTERDLPAMQAYWGEKLHFVFSNPRRYTLWLRCSNLLKRTLKIDRFKRLLLYGGRMGADEQYTPLVQRQTEQILHGKQFDVVICAYIFHSKILEKFGPSTLKIIDTIDAQSIRDERFLQNVFYTTPRQEAKALDRADIVMAIQAREKAYFQTITSRKVILLGHPVRLQPDRPLRETRRKLLFIGSSYTSNVTAIEYFIAHVFPLVQDRFPDAALVIAGRVCEKIGNYAGCTKVGTVEDLRGLYQEADVAINPILAGRGLKIKNIEALGYATPLVTTSVGAEGLEEGAGEAFLVGDTPEGFATQVIQLLSDAGLYQRVSKQAFDFAAQYNRQAFTELEAVIKVTG